MEVILRIIITNDKHELTVMEQIELGQVLGFDLALQERDGNKTIAYGLSPVPFDELPKLRFFKQLFDSASWLQMPPSWFRVGSVKETLKYLREHEKIDGEVWDLNVDPTIK